MLKKLSFLATFALAIIAGCSGTQKDNDLHAVKLAPKAQAIPMIADLEVADKKAMGQATGKPDLKEFLEKEAVAEALKQTDGDVLVGVNYFYENVNNQKLTVIAVGYPARYKNFRPKEIPKTEAEVLVGGKFFYKDGAGNDLSVSVKNVKPDVQPQQEPVAEHGQPKISTHVAPAVPEKHPQEE